VRNRGVVTEESTTLGSLTGPGDWIPASEPLLHPMQRKSLEVRSKHRCLGTSRFPGVLICQEWELSPLLSVVTQASHVGG
jgi:hypothetical protein